MKNIKNIVFKVLISIVVVLFFACIFLYTYNIPKDDDFDSPINALLKLNESTNLLDYFKQLIQHHSDHRLFYLRTTSLLFIKLFGHFNFQVYSILNSLLILPIFYYIVNPLFIQKKYWEIFIISLVVFTIIYHDSLIWAHVSSNYTPVFVCAILAIQQISKERITIKNFLISLLFSILALGCFGNGLFLLFVILTMLVIKKEYKFALIWLSISLVFSKLYFMGYTRSAYLPEHNYFGAFYGKALGLLSLLGSQIAINRYDINQNILFGFAVFSILIYFYVKNFKIILKNDTYFHLSALLMFCLVTLFVIAVGRVGNNQDYLGVLQDRYRFYGVFTLAILLTLYFIHKKTNPYVLTVLTAFFIFNGIISFINFKPELDLVFKKQYCSSYNFKNNQTGLIYYINAEKDANERLKKFIDLGYYKLPETSLFDQVQNAPRKAIYNKIKIKEENISRKFNEKLTVLDKLIYLEYPDFSGSSHRQNGCYFLLQSKDDSYYFGSIQNPYYGRNFLKNGSGVKSTITRNFLKTGEYKISIVEVQKNKILAVKESNQTIKI